jgi:uncharacterized alpha-E superfamily protein
MMLSRVAENLYWIGRYIERAENVARLLDVGFDVELDAAGQGGGTVSVEGTLAVLACRDAFVRAYAADRPPREAILRFLTFDRQHNHSILAMIGRARENARGTQEALSAELWSQLNVLYLRLSSRSARRRFEASPPRFYEGVKRSCVLFAGLIDGTLPRSEAYHFLQLGRGLERANQVSRLLQVHAGTLEPEPADDLPAGGRVLRWTALLRSCAAHEAYLRAHRDRIDPVEVVRFLVLDPHFPRAIRSCVAQCCAAIAGLGRASGGDSALCEAERRLGRLDGELRYLDVADIFGAGLVPFLVNVQESCNRIGEDIHQAYFFT